MAQSRNLETLFLLKQSDVLSWMTPHERWKMWKSCPLLGSPEQCLRDQVKLIVKANDEKPFIEDFIDMAENYRGPFSFVEQIWLDCTDELGGRTMTWAQNKIHAFFRDHSFFNRREIINTFLYLLSPSGLQLTRAHPKFRQAVQEVSKQHVAAIANKNDFLSKLSCRVAERSAFSEALAPAYWSSKLYQLHGAFFDFQYGAFFDF